MPRQDWLGGVDSEERSVRWRTVGVRLWTWRLFRSWLEFDGHTRATGYARGVAEEETWTMAFNRKVDLICGALETGLLLVLLPQWLPAKSYIASAILTSVLGGIAFGHFKGHRWAARASLYVVFIGTAFTIFGLFPPFDENDRATLPFDLKVAILIGLVAGSTALLAMLYLRLRPEGQAPRWFPNEPLIEFLRNTFVNSHAKSQDRRDET